MSKSTIAALGTALMIGIASPASAEITTIDFKGVGRVTRTIMSCYYIDEDLNEICPPLSEYGIPPIGSTIAFNGRFTTGYFPVPDVGFTSGPVDAFNLSFSVIPVDGPGTLIFATYILNGEMEFLNGRITSIDVTLGDEYCTGQGGFTWNRAAPASGRFGFEFCGWRDAVFGDAPFYGYSAEWRMTETSINGGAWTTIPEPRTWALFIIGFGGVGAAMRRQSDHKAILPA